MSSHHAAFPLKKEKISEYLYNSTANITPKAVGCCPLFFLPVLHLSPVRFHPRCTLCTALPVLHLSAPARLPAGSSDKIPVAETLRRQRAGRSASAGKDCAAARSNSNRISRSRVTSWRLPAFALTHRANRRRLSSPPMHSLSSPAGLPAAPSRKICTAS